MGFGNDRWQRWTWGSPPAQAGSGQADTGCGVLLAVMLGGAALTGAIWFVVHQNAPKAPPDVDAVVFAGTWNLDDLSAKDVAWTWPDPAPRPPTVELRLSDDGSLVGQADLGTCTLVLDEGVGKKEGDSLTRTDDSVVMRIEDRVAAEGGSCPQVTRAVVVGAVSGDLRLKAMYGSFLDDSGLDARMTAAP